MTQSDITREQLIEQAATEILTQDLEAFLELAK